MGGSDEGRDAPRVRLCTGGRTMGDVGCTNSQPRTGSGAHSKLLCICFAVSGVLWLLLAVQQKWFIVWDRQCACRDSSGLIITYLTRIDWWEGAGVAGILCGACAWVLHTPVRWRSRWLLYLAAVFSGMACAAQLLDGPDSLVPLRLRFDPGASTVLALSVVQVTAATWALWTHRAGARPPSDPLCP